MPISGTSAIEIYSLPLVSTLGCYVNDPESGPYIALKEGLNEDTKQMVQAGLMDYHEKLPADSLYRLFPMIVCYEDLVPASVPTSAPEEPDQEQEQDQDQGQDNPEIIVIGWEIRHRQYTYYEFVHPAPPARVIG